MPWKISEQDGKFCVVKEGGEIVKCHESREKATAHMRALYANVHEGIHELSMAIVKTSIKDGEMRWRSVNSDTGEDVYEERMSKELFDDMIERIKNQTPIPEPFHDLFCEEGWCGGMPYVSISHYLSGGGKNVPGAVRSIYTDGSKLKSTGVMYDSPLGRAIWKSLEKDASTGRPDKIRISIGFIDLEHSHGDRYTFTRKALGEKCPLCQEGIGDKIYKKGQLVHLALTRAPANPRTDVEVEKSMTTKLEDAESVIDDEEVLKSLELRSATVEDVLVVKAEEPCDDDMEEDGKKKKKGKKDDEEMEEESITTPPPAPPAETIPVPAAVIETPELTPVEKSMAVLKAKVDNLRAQGLSGDNALRELQGEFDDLANVVRAEFTPKPTEQEVANKNLETTLRSLLAEMLPQVVAQSVSQSVAPIQAEVSELRALSLAGSKPPATKQPEQVIQPRSLSMNLTQRAAVEKLSQFSRLANVSVGLPEDTVR